MTWEIDYTPPPTGAKFMQDDSRMRVLMGPVGCWPGHVEFLSPDGWKDISKWDGDKVYGIDIDTNEGAFVDPIRYIDKPATKWVSFEGGDLGSDWVTMSEDHRMPVLMDDGALKVFTALELLAHLGEWGFIGSSADNTEFIKPTDASVWCSRSDERKYCFTMPTGYFLVRTGGRLLISHNSGKSVTCCFEIVRRASSQAPGKDGKRRTRCAVVRETARQLEDTTIKTWLDWFPDGVCGHYMKTKKTYFFSVGDVECEVMFRALDDADDVANLNSLELTFAWFNECRDIHPDIVDAMSKRIGRYPSKKDGGPTWFGMWGDTNPPVMESWWYYQMEHINPSDGVSPNDNKWAVYKQPSGRSPYAENIENLPEGYYDTTGRSDEYIRVFIDGEYGLSSAGNPIYKYFRPDYHMAKEPIKHIHNGMRPIIIGMDAGLCPAAVFGQLDARGRALILAEAVSFDMGMQRFIRTMVRPLLMERFAGSPVLVVVDPAGVQRAQTDERSVVDIIRAEGFKVTPARTNTVTARINAVDDYLMRQVDGDPAFLVDPSCTRLKAAMMGGYRYKPRGDNVIDKNQHSHVAEALQYLMLHITSGGGVPMVRRREIQRVSSLGWT